MTGSAAARVLLFDAEASEEEIALVRSVAGDLAIGVEVTKGDGWAALPLGDGVRVVDTAGPLEHLPSVLGLKEISAPFRLASRELFGHDVSVAVPTTGAAFGGGEPIGVIVSSRWASTTEERFAMFAPLLREAGCGVFHAGLVARSQERDDATGVTFATLHRLRDIAHEHGLALGVEVWDAGQIAPATDIADLLQVGSRNMQDFNLLRELGGTDRPVLLRRGAGATVEEFLLAAEYVLVHGNGKVILCESGIRTFDAVHKPRFEINAVPLIKQLSHLPLVADPSQTAPHAATVPAMARAAIAAGADGLALEVGPEAVFDPEGVSIDVEAMRRLVSEVRPIARALGRAAVLPGPDGAPAPTPKDAGEVLHLTERTLAQTIESITGRTPELDVAGQWRLVPPIPWLSPPLSADGAILGRCTGYRMGSVRLSRNISYVDLARIDPTIGALLEATHLNLGQLFVDPRIEKLHFEFGTHETAGEIDDVLRRHFPGEEADLHPYVWRRYQAAIGGVVTFLVIEALPVRVWERLLDRDLAATATEGSAA